ncbi:hypothetical protein NIES970_08010 [[Synechococcus] sp. NIES-970]|uniref:DUF3288 family protein n=1 Tax=Picosynechococcus sp. NKBG15041c TaxID=1407650 RepID=UPI000400FF25|nr:DUF3288 family protein [Picosynechococcus sp. NKBG15041c]BAW95887.1 hypothetical protein NIES970_08010 [[Synechococcus] sp. NIES-970]
MPQPQQQDQVHPQANRDRLIVDSLLKGEPSEQALVELARLHIRYQGFPGAREIQRDLQLLFQQWGLTEETLFATTREIHRAGRAYKHLRHGEEQQDWS